MADIKYVSELNFKRGLKGLVDWIKDKFTYGELLDNSGYIYAAKFHNQANFTGYSISFGVDLEGTPYIQTNNETSNTVNLAQTKELTTWEYAAASQITPKRFTLTGPISGGSNPTISFIDDTTFKIRCNYGTGNDAITIEKSLATTSLVSNLDQWNVKWYFTQGSQNIVRIDTEYTGNDDKTYNFRMHYTPTNHFLNYEIYSQEDDNNVLHGQFPDITKVQEMINEGLGSISGVQFQVVQTLPATGVNGVFYLIANPTASGSNIYDEYVWVNKGTPETPDYAFERLGTMDVDLTDYTKESDFTALSNDEVDAILVEIGVKTATPTP